MLLGLDEAMLMAISGKFIQRDVKPLLIGLASLPGLFFNLAQGVAHSASCSIQQGHNFWSVMHICICFKVSEDIQYPRMVSYVTHFRPPICLQSPPYSTLLGTKFIISRS